MSLARVTDDLPPNATFNLWTQAHFLSQIIPAYEDGEVGADEVYVLALYCSPVATCPLYRVRLGSDRVERFV